MAAPFELKLDTTATATAGNITMGDKNFGRPSVAVPPNNTPWIAVIVLATVAGIYLYSKRKGN